MNSWFPTFSEYLFYSTIRQGSSLKHILELLQGYHDKSIITFYITQNGIKAQKITDGNYVFTKLEINRENMTYYHLEGDSLDFGISTKNWYNELKQTKAKEPITLFIEKSDPNKLYMQFQAKGNTQKKHYVLIQSTTQAEIMDDDDQPVYSYPICIDATHISAMCKECNNKSSKIMIYSTPNYIRFEYTKGGGFSGGVLECVGGDEEKKDLLLQELKTDSITKLQKISQISKSVKIYPPSVQNPLKLEISNEIGNIHIFIRTEEQLKNLSDTPIYDTGDMFIH